jgi:hypothetical protein
VLPFRVILARSVFDCDRVPILCVDFIFDLVLLVLGCVFEDPITTWFNTWCDRVTFFGGRVFDLGISLFGISDLVRFWVLWDI